MDFRILTLRRRETKTKSPIVGAPPKKKIDGIELILDYNTNGEEITPEVEKKVVGHVNDIINTGAQTVEVIPASEKSSDGEPDQNPNETEEVEGKSSDDAQTTINQLKQRVEEAEAMIEKASDKYIALQEKHRSLESEHRRLEKKYNDLKGSDE